MVGALTPVVRNLLLINLFIYLFQVMGQINFPLLFALRYFESSTFAPWQLITYMFVHADFMHIFSNMITLIMFGPLLESVFGPRRFLTFYMICGMGAGFFNYGVIYLEMQMQRQAILKYETSPSEEAFVRYISAFEPKFHKEKADVLNDYLDNFNKKASIELIKESYDYKINHQSVIGASGATFGIIMGVFLLFTNLQVLLFFLPIPIKLGYLAGALMLFDFYALIMQGQDSGVAHLAHLGGALIALFLIRYWKIPRQF